MKVEKNEIDIAQTVMFKIICGHEVSSKMFLSETGFLKKLKNSYCLLKQNSKSKVFQKLLATKLIFCLVTLKLYCSYRSILSTLSKFSGN